MTLKNLTPFLMLDHFHVGNGAVSTSSTNVSRILPLINLANIQGFPDHPHRGQATVTYMLEG
jgi:redox-sensitive bicupin YhaK (pirin superfamily)